jgi:crotonobetaine/carnitine-CoA ligase
MLAVGRRTLRSLLADRVAASADQLFLIFEANDRSVRRLTYGEFDAAVNRTAHLLRALGVGKGDTFNLHLPNCPEFLFFWFAAAKIGAVMVPTNILSTADEMQYILQHSESRLAVTMPEYLPAIEPNRPACPALRAVLLVRTATARAGCLLYDELVASQPDGVPPAEVDPLDEVGMVYTSGTTSRPKGCLITQANYVFVGECMSRYVQLRPDDRHIVVLPLFHVNAQYYSTMATIAVGASMALMERFSASQWIHQCRRHEATISSLFAAPIRMILNQPPTAVDGDNQLRAALFAQNVTEAQLAEFERRFNCPLVQLYGMTETIGTPLMNPLYGVRRNMTIGLPTLGYEVRVVDEQERDVAPGEVGQIIVRGQPGVSLMKGYFRNPQATADTIRGEWLFTGDNGRLEEDGYIAFVDRAKDMIKRAGENVSAGEIERVVNEHPAVFESCAIGIPDALRDEAIKVFVVLKEGQTLTAEDLIGYCATRLARFKVPSEVEFVAALPRTSVGKIQKHILRAQESARRGG